MSNFSGTVAGTSVTWAFVKTLIDNLGVTLHYTEDDDRYDLRALNGPLVYKCAIYKLGYEPAGVDPTQNTADRTEFLANYAPTANGLEKQAVNISNTLENPVSIVQVPAVVPGGGTKVSQAKYDSVSSDNDDTYVIPNGETLVIQSFSGGCEFKSQGSAIELWYDPNGNGSGMTIIDVIHVNGSSEQHSIYAQYEGNGTRKIRIRRRPYGGGSREVFGRWEGYY